MLRLCRLTCLIALLALADAWAAGPSSLRLVSDDWPPYEYPAAGTLDGFGVALCDTITQQMGVHMVKPTSVLPWARALATTQSGQADILISALFVADRQAWGMYPTEPLVVTRYALFGRSGHAVVPSPADLHDLRLGVVHRFHYTDGFIEGLPKSVTLVTAFTPQLNLENLVRGQVDLVIEDQYTAQFIIRQQHWQDRIALEPVLRLGPSPLYPVFSRKTVTPAVVEEFSRRLGEYKQTQAYRDLAARYGITP